MKKTILIIQPDEANFTLLSRQLTSIDISTDSILRCTSLHESLSIDPRETGFIFANLPLTSVGNNSPIKELKHHFVNVPIIILSHADDIENRIYAISQGAEDVLVNGQFDSVQLDMAMAIARERNRLSLRRKNVLEEYKRHFETGPIPMWIIDEKTTRFLIVNSAAVEKYGYSKEEFRGMSIIDIRPKEDIGPMLESFIKKQKDNPYDAGYWRHIKKSGEVFYVHIYSHNTEFENNDARLCFAVDVNDKLLADRHNKELVALISEQKEQLDTILSSIDEAIWSRDANTHELLYGNKAYYELYGSKAGQTLPNKNLNIETIHPDDRNAFLEAVSEVKRKGSVDYTYRYVNEDGSVKILKGKATYLKGINGKQDTIDGITTDITREKELYDTIRNSEQKLLSTINNTQDLIWSVDRELKIIFCNRAYQDFFGKWFKVSIDEGDYVLGSWHSEAFINRRREEYTRALNGESFTTLVEEHFEGDTQYFEINSSPIIDIDEKVIGVNCVCRDITEPEKQLNRINEQNEKLREIAWIQSHRVRGPVASILGLIPLFDSQAWENEGNKNVLEKLRAAASELDIVIKEIVNKTNEIESNILE